MPIKRYNGSGQITQAVKRWTGSAWVKQQVKRWTGSAWVNVSEPPPVYTWTVWGVKTVTIIDTYRMYVDGEREVRTGDDEQGTVATSYTFDSVTGWFTLSGEANLWSNGGGYRESGGMLEVIRVVPDEFNPRTGMAYITSYGVEPDQTRTEQQRDEQDPRGTVTSENPSAYPSNGIQGGLWYVKL